MPSPLLHKADYFNGLRFALTIFSGKIINNKSGQTAVCPIFTRSLRWEKIKKAAPKHTQAFRG